MLGNLKDKLSKTRKTFIEKFEDIINSEKNREKILEEITETLILADAGIQTSEKIIQNIKSKSRKTDSFFSTRQILKEEIIQMLSKFPSDLNLLNSQSVIMFVGVNGGGKTTSLAKLANKLKQEGNNVLMVAADTFRAAAQEQLVIWGKKLNIPVITGQYNADPASVVYDAIQSFKARNADILLIDTAGRIHTNINLMTELEKIKRITSREIENAPQEVLLILDSSIGQNALSQAKEFLKFSGITGVFLTKLDGTAKGGCTLTIVDSLNLPIKFIGVGEKEEDIFPFNPQEFTNALIS